jgi:hypothetical protein
MVAREFYAAADQPLEMVNRADDPEVAASRDEAAAMLRKQFPVVKHP